MLCSFFIRGRCQLRQNPALWIFQSSGIWSNLRVFNMIRYMSYLTALNPHASALVLSLLRCKVKVSLPRNIIMMRCNRDANLVGFNRMWCQRSWSLKFTIAATSLPYLMRQHWCFGAKSKSLFPYEGHRSVLALRCIPPGAHQKTGPCT